MGEHIKRLLRDSNLNFESINLKALVRFLALKSCNTGLEDYIPMPKGTTTLKSWLRTETNNQFRDPVLESCMASKTETNQLLGCCIAECIDVVMKNHFYTIGGVTYKQKDGSPMGLDTSVEGSDLYMLAWEHAFLNKLKSLGWSLSMYKRYVDDIQGVTMCLNKGWHYDFIKDKMIYSKDHPNSDLPDDLRTFKELLAIGNSLDTNIQLELDVPSLHNDNKLPILDLKVWVENGILRHEFYKKEVASKHVILQRSAISDNVKRETLFQEGLRRLRNCDTLTDTETIRQVLGEYSNCMRMSGYGPRIRRDILKGTLDRSKTNEEEIRQGLRKRFRNRAEIETGKQNATGKYKTTWFLKGEITSVMMVQPTQHGSLSKAVRDAIHGKRAPDGGLTKVVEMGGVNIMAGLNKPDPFRSSLCPFEDECWCSKETDCWKTRTIYRITCCLCGSQYTGTSGHTLHKRIFEHMNAVRRKDTKNAISKHFISQHQYVNTTTSEEQLFKATILSRKDSNLERYISEGVWIEEAVKQAEVEQLNSRGEWGRVSTKRLTVVEG